MTEQVKASVRESLLKLVGGLVMEQKNGSWVVSLGRVATWILLGHCLWRWNSGADAPDGELYTLWLLLGYGGVKIGARVVRDIAVAKAGAKG